MKKALIAVAMAAVFLIGVSMDLKTQTASFEEVQLLETTPVQTSILQNVAEMRQDCANPYMCMVEETAISALIVAGHHNMQQDLSARQEMRAVEETAISALIVSGHNNMQQYVASTAPPNSSICAKVMKTTALLSTRSATAAARSIGGEFRLT